MMDKTYSTGQVSGMLEIPIRTIQDYVKSFRDVFSEGARQRAKGRRFTDADIKTLLTIKRARSQRISDDEIRMIISGENPILLPLASEYNEQDIKQIAIHATQKFEIASRIFNQCEKFLDETETWFSEIKDDFNMMRDDIATINATLKSLKEWRVFVMQTNPNLNPYIDKAIEKELAAEQKLDSPKKKGWF